jgi:hypothetical protein
LCRRDLAHLVWADCQGSRAPAAPATAQGGMAAPAQAGYEPYYDVTEVFVVVGRLVVGVVVVVVGAVIVGAVIVGAAVVVVGSVVDGGLVGKVVQPIEVSGVDTWSAGTVATAAPLWSTPTTVAPASTASPGTASTTMLELGAMASTRVSPDDRWTDATPLPTHTATQPTDAPSSVPKEPTPRISTASGEGAAVVGRGTEPLPTALLVDSSTTNCPHSAAGCGGTVPEVPEPVVPTRVGWGGTVSGVPTAEPEATSPSPAALPPPVVPLCACGVTSGCAHTAPCGHGTDPGTRPTGGQGTVDVQPPVVLLPDPKTRMVTLDEVVRVNRNVYGVWPAMAGRFGSPAELGASDAPARPGTVVDGAAASGVAVDLPPTKSTPVRTPEPARMTARDTAPIARGRRRPDRPTERSMSAPGSGSAWTCAVFPAKWARRRSSNASLTVRSPFSGLPAPGG